MFSYCSLPTEKVVFKDEELFQECFLQLNLLLQSERSFLGQRPSSRWLGRLSAEIFLEMCSLNLHVYKLFYINKKRTCVDENGSVILYVCVLSIDELFAAHRRRKETFF